MRFLITGFPPFPGRPTNPTQSLIEHINQNFSLGSHEVQAILLPVEYRAVESAFESAVAEFNPDVVLSFGVGRHRQTLRLEACGENLDDATIPDNAGDLRQSVPIVENGPQQLHSPLRIDHLAQRLHNAEVECEISQNAGRYVCNHLLYYASYQQQIQNQSFRFLFAHLPTEENGFDLKVAARGIETMIEWFTGEHAE